VGHDASDRADPIGADPVSADPISGDPISSDAICIEPATHDQVMVA